MTLALIPHPTTVTTLEGALLLSAEGRLAVERARSAGEVFLELGAPASLGEEGYVLDVDTVAVRLWAHHETGLFRGIQTLRQLVGPDGSLPAVHIEDRPRFAWRGAMLDVARHFFTVSDVKRFIDLVAPYKINVLHLHLTDDQGWRLASDAYPRLTEVGAQTQVGGGAGGHYTAEDYREIVQYAAARHLTVVPEIDMPGHTNAASVAYPELNGAPLPAEPYTGTRVGFSTLATTKPETLRFVEAVLREVAALTPGPYVHIGGDEAHSTDAAAYAAFIPEVERIVRSLGKTMVGWQEISSAPLTPGNVVQYWRAHSGVVLDPAPVRNAVAQGAKVIMSPARHTYLDMKYDPSDKLGLDWAGYLDARTAYEWDPATLLDGVDEPDILGVEAALWTETLSSFEDLSSMLLPRLPGIAEVAWTSGKRTWSSYAPRLEAHKAQWQAAGLTHADH